MNRILLPAALLALCFAGLGCGGRASLSEESARAYNRLWQTQTDSQPRNKLASLSAGDATIIMDNHHARFAKGSKGTAGGYGGMGFSGGAGNLTPATTELSELGVGDGDGGGAAAGGPGGRGIKLRAK